MKIYHKDANLLISKIIHSHINDIKKLSQTDRKICMKAIECLSSKEDKGININLPCQLSFDKAINHIQNILESNIKSKKMFLIQLIISVAKGILNFLHLRINSGKIYKNINLVKKSYLTNNWDQYLKDYCDVTANCDLNKAKIVFMGDQHVDFIQNKIRRNLIDHYANKEQIGENLLLHEGLNTNDYPRILGDKKFVVKSWEIKEHFEEHGKVIDKFCKFLKETHIEFKKIEQIKKNEKYSLKEKKQNVIDILAKIKNIQNQIAIITKRSDKLKVIRDKDLITKVKLEAALKQDQKIFVIAGSAHILEDDYRVIDFFKDFPCAVIIPKESKSGKRNKDKFLQNVLKLGTYNAACHAACKNL